jgi:carbamoyltransferase
MSHSAEPWVLGYASSHNGGACLLKGDKIIAAIQEERLLRQKRAYHLGSRASLASQYCLNFAGISPADLSMVVFSSVMDNQDVLEDIGLNPTLRVAHHSIPTVSIGHHMAHAIGAYATSGFRDSAILVIDGCGSPVSNLSKEEQDAVLPQYRDRYKNTPPNLVHETISIYSGAGTTITPVEKHVSALTGPGRLPPSLGHMYEEVAAKIFGLGLEGAGKVMGLAPFGTPNLAPHVFFEIINGQFVVHENVIDRICPWDEPWPSHEKQYSDLAASVQVALERGVLHLVRRAFELTGQKSLCYAGGVALNSIANERIHREGIFRQMFTMPAAEDSGTAIGAAYHGLWKVVGTSSYRRLRCDAVGRSYPQKYVENAIGKQSGLTVIRESNLSSRVAELLANGSIVGWFQGRSEMGPRALGQRSILCDPRRPDMKDRLNSRIKFREPFRPFAPAILHSEVREWFEVDSGFEDSPYMLRVVPLRPDKRQLVPAVVHVDGTGRLQTVSDQDDHRFYSLLKAFHKKTGCPILLNTSFNIAGEPIVESPEDALRCLLLTELDYCVIDDFLITKDSIHPSLFEFYPKLSSAVMWTDLLTRDRRSNHAPAHSGRRAGLLRSFHFDYFGSVDITTIVSTQNSLHRLAARTSDELVVNVGDDLPRVVVSSRWGLIVHILNRHLYDLLKSMDGTLCCTELQDRARQMAPDFFDLATFRRSIASLARAGIITLEAEPVGYS